MTWRRFHVTWRYMNLCVYTRKRNFLDSTPYPSDGVRIDGSLMGRRTHPSVGILQPSWWLPPFEYAQSQAARRGYNTHYIGMSPFYTLLSTVHTARARAPTNVCVPRGQSTPDPLWMRPRPTECHHLQEVMTLGRSWSHSKRTPCGLSPLLVHVLLHSPSDGKMCITSGRARWVGGAQPDVTLTDEWLWIS
jgi:hypothetical protein